MEVCHSSLTDTRSWRISKYSRLKSPSSQFEDEFQPSDADWLHVEDDEEHQLRLQLDLTARLSVTRGLTILENFFLVDSSKWLKGFHKGSQLVISYKCAEKIRMFRLQFRECESCYECVTMLEAYFPITPAEYEELQEKNAESLLPIDPHVSQVCSCLLTGQTLPELYQKCNYDVAKSPSEMEKFVTVCLTDPNFPAFVSQVSKVLDQVMGE